MLPSLGPTVTRFSRSAARSAGSRLAHAPGFVGGYLAVWMGLGVAAAFGFRVATTFGFDPSLRSPRKCTKPLTDLMTRADAVPAVGWTHGVQ